MQTMHPEDFPFFSEKLTCICYVHLRLQPLDVQPLSRGCEHEVRRAMRRRAKNIDLEPELEQECLMDLGLLCSDLKEFGKGHVSHFLQ